MPSHPKPQRALSISPAEWVVLSALWGRPPQTSSEVVEAVARTQGWQPKTVHTLLRRLVKKRAVRLHRSRRPHRFEPLVSREEAAIQESRGLIARLFGGQTAPFLACLLQHEALTREEVQELRRLLKEGGHD